MLLAMQAHRCYLIQHPSSQRASLCTFLSTTHPLPIYCVGGNGSTFQIISAYS